MRQAIEPVIANVLTASLGLNELRRTVIARAGYKEYDAIRHYIDVIMTTMASQITSLTVVYCLFRRR